MQQYPSLPSRVLRQRAVLIAVLVLIVLPALLLRRALTGEHDYVPFDITTFPPASVGLTPTELAKRKAGANYDITEKTLLCAPEYRLAREELVEGRFPHWNPYVRSGAPLFANALDGFAYPVHWLFFLLSPERSFGFGAWLAFALAGVFMFGFLREVGLRSMPALFGAVVFQLSGTLAANGHFFMRMETLVWLPAGFWALERLFQREGMGRIPSLCAFSLSLGLCWLAGFPPYALACSLVFGLYMLALGVRESREHGVRRGAVLPGWFAVATVIGIAVAGIQLLPMFDYYPEAQRELSQSAASLAAQGLDPAAALGLTMPAPFGSPLESATIPYDKNPLLYLLWSRTHPETGKLLFPLNYNYTEYALYLGVLPLVCILLSVFRGGVRFRRFALPAFVFFFLFAGGGWLFQQFAGLWFLQSAPPMRFASVLAFLGASLAAIGLEIGPTQLSRWKHHVAFALVLGLAAALGALAFWAHGLAGDTTAANDAVLGRVSQHWMTSFPEIAGDAGKLDAFFGSVTVPALLHVARQASFAALAFVFAALWVWLLPGSRRPGARTERLSALLVVVAIVATAAELMTQASAVNPTFPHRAAPDTLVHRFLRQAHVATRGTGGFTVARVASKTTTPTQLPPNTLIPEHIRDLNCYAFTDGRSYKPFLELYGEGQMIRSFWIKALPADERLQLGLFDLFGVRYLLATEELPALGQPAIPPLSGPGGGFWVYERKSALPRAFLVERAEILDDDQLAIARLIAKDFQPRKTMLLHPTGEGDPGQLDTSQHSAESLARAHVRFVTDEPAQTTLLVTDSPGAWLVLTDTAMSHWNATIDSGEVAWHRADLCFRAVWVPPGDHEIGFSYDATPFRHGLFVTAFALGSLLFLMLYWTGRPHREETDTDIVQAA